jgi:hypothetical protein
MNAALAQEEILFCVKPECLAAMALVEVMEPHESIIITGAERFADYSGYHYGLKFKGPIEEETPLVSEKINAIRNHIGTSIKSFDMILYLNLLLPQSRSMLWSISMIRNFSLTCSCEISTRSLLDYILMRS